MEYVTLNNDIKMPKLGIRTMVEPTKAEETVSMALKNDYKLIDTAAAYGTEEGVVLMEHYQVDVASAYVCGDYLGKDEEFAKKNGAILFTGGGFVRIFATIPVLKVLCIDKAAMNAAGIVLHDMLAPKGIYVGSVLVSGVIAEGDEKYDPALIAKQYWKMYTEGTERDIAY